jgi:hypothetical protein
VLLIGWSSSTFRWRPAQAGYLKLNPGGVVPTLVIDGKPFTESAALLMALASVIPTRIRADAGARGAPRGGNGSSISTRSPRPTGFGSIRRISVPPSTRRR